MMSRNQWREFSQSKPVRTALFMVGLLLIIVSPLAGAIPGPGGVFVFAAGLALALKNSEWAKRQYVRFKRKRPKAGRWADWGLRRRSARRREALRKQRSGAGADLPLVDEARESAVGELIPDAPLTAEEASANGARRSGSATAAD